MVYLGEHALDRRVVLVREHVPVPADHVNAHVPTHALMIRWSSPLEAQWPIHCLIYSQRSLRVTAPLVAHRVGRKITFRTQNASHRTQIGRASDAKRAMLHWPQVVPSIQFTVRYQNLRTVRTQNYGTIYREGHAHCGREKTQQIAARGRSRARQVRAPSIVPSLRP